MINYDMVMDRVAIIKRSVQRLEKLRNLTIKEFQSDMDNYAIGEHNLRIALEGVFDIGRHIIVKSGMGKPDDYRHILVMLNQNGILPEDFFNRIKGMAGYRNRLVHLYNEVNSEELYEIIRDKLDDIRDYISYILKYIQLSKK